MRAGAARASLPLVLIFAAVGSVAVSLSRAATIREGARAGETGAADSARARVKGEERTEPGGAHADWVAVPGAPSARALLEHGRDIVLLVQAGPEDTFDRLAARYAALDVSGERVREANPGRREIRSGAWYRVPLALLASEWRAAVLLALFPGDAPGPLGWVHAPAASPLDTYGEGAWQVAEWFTGAGEKFREILAANSLEDPILPRGREIIVPAGLLTEPFLSAWKQSVGRTVDRLPAEGPDRSVAEIPEEARDGASEAMEEPEPAAAPPLVPPADLSYARDKAGEYATYRLKQGEALYSSVVVRFTGRVDPEDVSEAASLIARRSAIRDVSAIPIGYPIKIPTAMLLPEYLPPGDRRREEVVDTLRETARVKNPVRSKNLEGIHVILDAGHGGIDTGALIQGIAEHEYVYDVVCRIKRILETETGAIVHPTILDPGVGYTPRNGRVLLAKGGETILTTPVHVNGATGETALGVNLRWYLANSLERRLRREGVDPSRIVFASLHADVLHPSLRGAMIYVAGERYTRGTQHCGDPDCDRYAEVREAPTVRASRTARISSEGLSRQFAGLIVKSLLRRGINVHPYQPVRDRIIRRGREWVPAVLRGNTVPVKVLVEMANLNNGADRSLVQDPRFRESFARAFVDALLRYYKARSSPAPARPGLQSARESPSRR